MSDKIEQLSEYRDEEPPEEPPGDFLELWEAFEDVDKAVERLREAAEPFFSAEDLVMPDPDGNPVQVDLEAERERILLKVITMEWCLEDLVDYLNNMKEE